MWLKSIVRWTFGGLVSKFIMPSQSNYPRREIDPNKLNKIRIVDKIDSHNIYGIDRIVASTGKAEIFFREYQSAREFSLNKLRYSPPTSNNKIIISAVGNGDVADLAGNMLKNMAHNNLGCRVVGFDCRNVDRSRGRVKSENDWVADAMAVIDYYHNIHKIPYENIILFGHSLGAAILTMAAAQIYKRELKKYGGDEPRGVYLINSRSFRDLPSVVAEYINLKGLTGGLVLALLGAAIVFSTGFLFGFSLMIAGIVSGGIATLLVTYGLIFREQAKLIVKFIVGGLINYLFGKMEAAKAFEELPEERRDYIYVKDDEVIQKAGIHQAMKSYYKCRIRGFEQRIENLKHEMEYLKSNPAKKKAIKLEINELKLEIIRIQQRKLYTDANLKEHRVDPNKPAIRHTVGLNELWSWNNRLPAEHKITGQKRLENQLDIFLDPDITSPTLPVTRCS